MERAFLVVAALAAAWGIAGTASAEQYLCSAEQVQGFVWQKGEESENDMWKGVAMKPGTKYEIDPSTIVDGAFELRDFGQKCSLAEPQKFHPDGSIHFSARRDQEDIFEVFHFNRKTLRFLHAYAAGYYAENLDPLYTNTPYMEIGTCTPY